MVFSVCEKVEFYFRGERGESLKSRSARRGRSVGVGRHHKERIDLLGSVERKIIGYFLAWDKLKATELVRLYLIEIGCIVEHRFESEKMSLGGDRHNERAARANYTAHLVQRKRGKNIY